MDNTSLPTTPTDFTHLVQIIISLQEEINRLEATGHSIVQHLHAAVDKEKLQHVVNNIHNFN